VALSPSPSSICSPVSALLGLTRHRKQESEGDENRMGARVPTRVRRWFCSLGNDGQLSDHLGRMAMTVPFTGTCGGLFSRYRPRNRPGAWVRSRTSGLNFF
jgi:hypothetical protein